MLVGVPHAVRAFMLWNLYLATIPTVLAIVLFRRPTRTGPMWWLMFGGWLLFLPNAPYVLTDVVHMFHDLRVAHTLGRAGAILVMSALFAAAGLASYATSMQLFGGSCTGLRPAGSSRRF
jgi:uncharacterized membrane protein